MLARQVWSMGISGCHFTTNQTKGHDSLTPAYLGINELNGLTETIYMPSVRYEVI